MTLDINFIIGLAIGIIVGYTLGTIVMLFVRTIATDIIMFFNMKKTFEKIIKKGKGKNECK